MNKTYILLGLIIVVILVMMFWGSFLSNKSEHAKYQVIKQLTDNIEIRKYEQINLASTDIEALDRKDAINQGFKIIADYIFGNNDKNIKISMTVPVIQQKIADYWQITFVMPSEYSLAQLPKPTNTNVTLKEINSKEFIVVTFYGNPTDQDLAKQKQILEQSIQKEDLKVVENQNEFLAFYHPPWTIPILKKNEIMIEINYSNH